MNARYMDPVTGSFTSSDPVQGVIGGPSVSFSAYPYAQNNPVNMVDPTGEFPWVAAAIAVAWFTRGAAIDITMQVALEGRTIHNLDWGRAIVSGGIDVATGGLSTYAKGVGYSARAINRLDFAADVVLSSSADVALAGQDPLSAFAGNTVFGAVGRVGAHQAGRLWQRSGIGNRVGRTMSLGGNNPCRANSFSADTLVSTPDGDVAISEIVVGDTVYAYNELTGEVEEHTVVNTFIHDDDQIVYLTIDGEEIETTPWHPFYTDAGWEDAGDLQPGDLILSLDGDYGVVDSVAIVAETQTMYDLDVETVDTFAVGDGAWVVHNVDGCSPFGLTNFDTDTSTNIEFNKKSLDSIVPENAGESFGAGWTGAFDMETKTFLAIPSDPMYTRTIDGVEDLVYLPNVEIKPENLQQGIVVARTGGHGAAAQILRRQLGLNSPQDGVGRIVGMNLSYWNANELTMGWKSKKLFEKPSPCFPLPRERDLRTIFSPSPSEALGRRGRGMRAKNYRNNTSQTASNGLNLGSPYAIGSQVAPDFQGQIIDTIEQVLPPSVVIRNP
jgi:hypothetical protein